MTEDISMTMCKLITTEDQGRSRASAVQISTERDDHTGQSLGQIFRKASRDSPGDITGGGVCRGFL